MAELTEEERLKQLEEMLNGMSNEAIAKLLLNKTLSKLALLLEADMATAADYNVVRSILKDNNIGIVPTRENAAGKLEQKLKEAAARRSTTPGIIDVDKLDDVSMDDFVQRH